MKSVEKQEGSPCFFAPEHLYYKRVRSDPSLSAYGKRYGGPAGGALETAPPSLLKRIRLHRRIIGGFVLGGQGRFFILEGAL